MKRLSRWPIVPLGEVVEEANYGTALRANEHGAGMPVLRMNNITYGGALDLTELKHVELPLDQRERYSVRRGDLLFNRTNSQDLVGKTGVWNRDEPYAFAGYLVRLRLKRHVADPAFVAAWFNTPGMKTLLRTRAKPSINMSNINATEVLQFPIVLPPLSEQRRIAEVLDQAEGLRAKRRTTLAQLVTLTEAIFLDLFGDLATNPKGWPRLPFQDALLIPLRNGLSPSRSGKVSAKVLTLSAITGDAFDGAAWKTSTFQSVPPPDQVVNGSDFLICRGNGTVRLVGKGYFPTTALPHVTFPDTIIAARVSPRRFDRAFFQHVWHSGSVRRQIESLARTTNGTFKVNQTMLEGITICAPPLTLQRDFSAYIAAVDKLKTAHRASLAQLDALFASLQHRAFRGEL